MTVLIIGHACCSAFWSCANGWPSSVNTFISCRLTAAAAEQKTSSGMNQMKEQIIPSSPWMTCSSDPKSVFASLASLKALLPKFSIGKSVWVWVCVSMCVCVCMCVCMHVFRLSLACTTLFQSLLTDDERLTIEPTTNTGWNLIQTNDGCQHFKCRMIFPLNLRAETQAALTLFHLLPPLRQWSSICSCFPMCLCQRLLADLALTWPRKQKICSFLYESTKFNTQPFSSLCKPCCPRGFQPSDNNW